MQYQTLKLNWLPRALSIKTSLEQTFYLQYNVYILAEHLSKTPFYTLFYTTGWQEPNPTADTARRLYPSHTEADLTEHAAL